MCLDSRAPSVLRLPCGVPVLMKHATTKKGEATLSHCGTIGKERGKQLRTRIFLHYTERHVNCKL